MIIGGIVSALAIRRFGGQSNLEKRLHEAEQQFKNYQADVTEHFEETSRRVNALTRNYKDVHEYLASSAMKLTNPQMSRAISQAAQQNLPSSESLQEEDLPDSYIDSEEDEFKTSKQSFAREN
jgi:hypothetical protein